MRDEPSVHVSDTTAITNLAAIGRLDLIEAIFGRVLIPEAVFRELTRHGDRVPGAIEVRSSQWIEVRAAGDRALVGRLSGSLDLGEAEAIALAVETAARTLIIDERAGRQAAIALGIPIVGVLGILIESKRRGIVRRVRPLLDGLRTEAGFRIGRELFERVLREAGED